MSGFVRKIITAAVATSLLAVPTVAIGAQPSVPVAAVQSTVGASPWLALSAMTTNSSAATAAVAAQGYEDEGPGFPPIAPLVVILATIAAMVYILASNDDHDKLHFNLPISPN